MSPQTTANEANTEDPPGLACRTRKVPDGREEEHNESKRPNAAGILEDELRRLVQATAYRSHGAIVDGGDMRTVRLHRELVLQE